MINFNTYKGVICTEFSKKKIVKNRVRDYTGVANFVVDYQWILFASGTLNCMSASNNTLTDNLSTILSDAKVEFNNSSWIISCITI